MSNTNQKYWQRRAVRYEQEWTTRCAETVEKRLTRHYERALGEIKNDILQLYGTFAKDNGLDFNEARQVLSGREYRQWRMSMREYLDAIESGDVGLTRELNTLAMRPRINRLEKLYGETLQELDKLGRNVSDDMRNFLADAYKGNYTRDIFDLVKVGGLSVALIKVDAPNIERVLAARWSGKNYSQRIWTNTRLLSGALRNTVAAGVHQGLSVPQMSRLIEDKMHAGYSNAVRLVRTEMNFVNNQAHAESMNAAGVAYYEFIAVLDNRTSKMCQSRDGEAYPLEEKSVGFNYPPLHPRCRSTVAPYIEGASRAGSRIAKVGKDTIHIPAAMNYRDYEAVYVRKEKTLEQWQENQRAEKNKRQQQLARRSSRDNASLGKAVEQQVSGSSSLKERIEPLRQKLEQQKAIGASAAEMEQTVKAAGKLVVEDVKKLKLYDVSAEDKIDLDLLRNTLENYRVRISKILDFGEERRKLFELLREMYAELDAIEKVTKPLQDLEIHRKRSEQIAGIISSIRPVATIKHTRGQFKNVSKVRPLMFEALTRYPADWVEDSVNFGKIKLLVKSRGYYDDEALELACNLQGLDTGIHEYGHRMEHVIKRLKEMERAFYERRTKGEKLERLRDICPENGYGKSEMARKDKFLDAYMGKDYGGEAYELVSMGFQYAYTDPKLLLQDEDMAEWIYGLLVIF